MNRRASPRMWNHDWYVMSRLASQLEDVLSNTTLHLAGKQVLDFGCESSPYKQFFLDRGASYVGADINGSPDLIIQADGSLPVPDHSYDMVVSFQVLEHVWDVDKYLQEAHRVLRTHGRLLLTTHGTWLYHPHPQDYRRWTRAGLCRELETRGFRQIQLIPVAGPLAWTTVLRLIGISTFLRKLPLIGMPIANVITVLMNAKAWLEDYVTPDQIKRDNACIYIALFKAE